MIGHRLKGQFSKELNFSSTIFIILDYLKCFSLPIKSVFQILKKNLKEKPFSQKGKLPLKNGGKTN